jgi:hypothetical protein
VGGFTPFPVCGVRFKLEPTGTLLLDIPQVYLLVLSIAGAVIPWLGWQFSLRTLLIATTLIAVVLGLIAWSNR